MAITVTDVDEFVNSNPVISTATAVSVVEMQTAVIDVNATDVDAADVLTYALSGADSAAFDIGATTGVVTFKVAPDFLSPTDTDNNNVYDTIVTVTDGNGGTVSQDLTVAVTRRVNPATTAPSLPPAPRFTDNVRPSVTWSPVEGVTGYEIWFSRITPSPSRIFIANSIISTVTEWSPPTDLQPALYRYWVRTVSAGDVRGPWSTAEQFDVRPTLIGPLSPAFDARPTFSWQTIPLASGYEIYIHTQDRSVGNNGVIRVSDIPAGTTSYTPDQDLPAGTVRWWIRASDSIGNRGWSEVGITGVRTSILAANASQISWQTVTGAGRYILHIEDMTTREVVIRQDQLTDSTFSLSVLSAGNYRAWIKAIDGVSNSFASGKWSRSFDFTVVAFDDDPGVSEVEQTLALTSLVSPTSKTDQRGTPEATQERKADVIRDVDQDRGNDADEVYVQSKALGFTVEMIDRLMADRFAVADVLGDGN